MCNNLGRDEESGSDMGEVEDVRRALIYPTARDGVFLSLMPDLF